MWGWVVDAAAKATAPSLAGGLKWWEKLTLVAGSLALIGALVTTGFSARSASIFVLLILVALGFYFRAGHDLEHVFWRLVIKVAFGLALVLLVVPYVGLLRSDWRWALPVLVAIGAGWWFGRRAGRRRVAE